MSDSPEARAGAPPHEQGLSQEGHEQAVALIMSFCALDQVGRLYEINNKLVQRVLNDMLNTVAQLSDGQNSVSLTLSGYSFFLNHQLIRMDFTKYQKAQQLKAIWQRLEMDEAIFPADLSLPGLEEFAGAVMKALADPESRGELFNTSWGGISVRRVVGDDKAGDDALPMHQVAARIYCVLVALMEQVMGRLKADQKAPVLQLKQAIQAAVDHMEAYKGMLLAISRISPLPPSVATHLVNTTLLSLKIGHQLGLRRSELMTLATGAIFHDLPKIGLKEATLNSLEHPERAGPKDRAKVAKHWLKTLNKVFMSTALSEDAMARLVVMLESQLEFSMLSLYSAAKREKGQAALSLLGRIISVCDDFDTLTWERSGKKPLAPHPAMMKLLEGGTKRHGLPMLKIFMETFGIYPTGSLVHLDSGEVAMVLDQNRSAPARPFVRVVLDANDEAVRGPALDLLENRDLNILWYADNDKIGANLAGCLKDD